MTSKTISHFSAYDAAPEGRLSFNKVVAYADELNAELAKAGATTFIEIGHRYNYYAVDQLNSKQYAYRQGDRINGKSSIARTFATGLTARQCVDSARELFYQAFDEVQS